MEKFILILLIVAFSVLFLAIRLFFGRSFVKTHVDQNKAMRQRGIGCVQSQDAAARNPNPNQVKEKNI